MRTRCALTTSFVFTMLAAICAGAGWAALRGHGGPVRALAISSDGVLAVTGSFDSSAILWNLANDAAIQVLRHHDSAVNAVAILPDGRLVTAGEDARIALWRLGATQPLRTLSGHTAPISGVAVAPDGKSIATSSWDRTVRLSSLETEETRVLTGHADNVNAVAFSSDGKTLISGGYDATIRIWPLSGGAPTIRQQPAPVNALVVAPDGDIVAAFADGRVRMFDATGGQRSEIEIASAPLVALALSPDGATIAAAGLRGAVALFNRRNPAAMTTLVGPALPVWALAFAPDGRTLLAAGSDRLVRRWDAQTGETRDGVASSGTDDILKANADDPGAEIFKACVACHTLTKDDGNRAGPTLHGLFGRRIATAPGYRYSDALSKMDIVWTAETVAKLFEVGPNAYTPGTKMPEQTLSNPVDRQALVKFLARVAR
ncbi:MAG: c-type cytochrome [Beijerinckiaceae bacterium]